MSFLKTLQTVLEENTIGYAEKKAPRPYILDLTLDSEEMKKWVELIRQAIKQRAEKGEHYFTLEIVRTNVLNGERHQEYLLESKSYDRREFPLSPPKVWCWWGNARADYGMSEETRALVRERRIAFVDDIIQHIVETWNSSEEFKGVLCTRHQRTAQKSDYPYGHTTESYLGIRWDWSVPDSERIEVLRMNVQKRHREVSVSHSVAALNLIPSASVGRRSGRVGECAKED